MTLFFNVFCCVCSVGRLLRMVFLSEAEMYVVLLIHSIIPGMYYVCSPSRMFILVVLFTNTTL
jgi:hypothetical protein